MDVVGHVTWCHCSAIVNITPHQFQVGESISSTQHSTVCSCGAESQESHTGTVFLKNPDSTANHCTYCECGYYMGTDPHVLPAGTATIKFCLQCGQKVTSGGIGVLPNPQSVPSIRYITDAGSYVDSTGTIYLVDSDIDLFMAGELDIDALIDALDNHVTQ